MNVHRNNKISLYVVYIDIIISYAIREYFLTSLNSLLMPRRDGYIPGK